VYKLALSYKLEGHGFNFQLGLLDVSIDNPTGNSQPGTGRASTYYKVKRKKEKKKLSLYQAVEVYRIMSY
jgi:hypothetical protein